MTIFLNRHGDTVGNQDRAAYNEFGDVAIELTDLGWEQTIAAGKFLSAYIANETNITAWPRLWASSLLRTQQSLAGLLHGMKDITLSGEPRIFEDSNLVEQDYGWLRYLNPDPADPAFKNFSADEVRRTCELLKIFSAKAQGHGKFTARPPSGEAPQDAEVRAIHFINTLRRDLERGVEHHIVETHGATLKALIKRGFHLPMSAWDKLKTPGNADIFRIDTDPVTHRLQSIRQIYDGQAMKAVNLNPIAGLHPLQIADLPQVPLRFR